MASSDLSGELSCSICLGIYTNPVMLTCGHNFCEDCIANTWVKLRRSGNYSCPECRAEFETRPVLQKNLKLCNIVEHYRSSQKNTEVPEIFCTYCVSSLLPAVKTCLRCEASFCELHLKNHSKSTNHTLVEPLNTLEERKCPVHNEFIQYFCVRDSSLLCTSCTMSWKHKGHETELLSEASAKVKVRLTEFTKRLSSKTDMEEKSLWGLEEDRNNLQKQVADLKERVTNIFGDIRTELNDLENKVLEEITSQETRISVSYSEQIQRLDKQIHEMYKKKRHIEEVCKITDPLMFLKQSAINTDFEQESPFNAEDLNKELINVTLMRALYKLSHIIKEQKAKYDLGDSSDMTLNINTANNYIGLSYDLKKATDTDKEKSRSNHSDRFTTQQVLSSKRITSGKHYWEIQTSDYGAWSVGVTYNNVKRKGDCSLIGSNPKSWCLTWIDEELTADHDDESYDVDASVPRPDIGIYLDYDGGVISFYELSDSFQHLYTFLTNFTKPLYAGFYLDDKAWIKIAN
ncbi:E3 ubiquitin/ISG15 ligase TRIM25-like [Bufo gargarizans]|uniref:E3 ubiquitin/ISG15 ligase TRIM25-like n=1 Tax=Bufo gargarizans TaxID=30331 RepID=UPI001CF3E7A5|nr:E3 ubiquitin/ISG15 ligase TRIM25-like [Bufo gargarizans]